MRALGDWLAARVAVPDVAPARRRRPAAWAAGRGSRPRATTCWRAPPPPCARSAPAAGVAPAEADALVAALVPADARARTGALSATLLVLAAGGAAPEPVHRLLAAGPEAARERALADLGRLGASTGRAVAAGVALAARYLTLGTAQG